MWISTLMAAGFLLGQVAAAPPADVARQVASLIRQLDDDRAEVRQNAEAKLLELGPDILELLPAADAPMTPEVRQRLARVREQLQVEHARRSLEASHVTLDGDMPVAKALQALQDQTGNTLLNFEEFDQPVKVHCAQAPFWEALDQVLDQAHLRVDPFAGAGRGFAVVQADTSQAPRVAYAGLFRFEPTMVSAVRDLRDPALAGMRVRLLIMWEPRTMPIYLTQRLSAITARDETGRAVEVSGRQGALTASVETDLPWVELELPFALPDRSAHRIALLQGTIDIMLPGPIERFEFKDLGHAVHAQQHRAGVTVELEQTRANDDAQEVHMRVSFADAGRSLESHRGWIYRNSAYLLDPEGNRLVCGGQRVTSQESDAVGMVYLFALTRPLADYRFVYETPALIMSRSLSYELKDIDLP
jgi:hypothetical protein